MGRNPEKFFIITATATGTKKKKKKNSLFDSWFHDTKVRNTNLSIEGVLASTK